MSLQRMHLKGKMTNGADRKMTHEEFNTLMNQAYKFLSVEVPKNVTEAIFQETDTDKDNLITYVQYFQVIDKYICKKTLHTKSKPEPVQQGPERFSKLRILMWKNLRALYEAYVSGRQISAIDKELRGLITAIVGELSET